MTLDQILDAVLELPNDQQEMFFDIIRHRQIEARRREIAQTAQEARQLLREGKLKVLSPSEAIAELQKALLEDEPEE